MTVDKDLDLLLDQIFEHQPAIDVNTYIVSAIAQLRRTLDRRRDSLLPPACSLPSWILSEPQLGPYETRMLETLLSSPGPVIVFRGGTGSGKSSALGYLQGHVRRSASELAKKKQIPLGCTNLLLTIDLNQVLPANRIDGVNFASSIATEDICSYIAGAIAASLDQEFSTHALGSILIQTCTVREPVKTLGLRHVVLQRLRAVAEPSPDTWQANVPSRAVPLFQAAVDKLKPSQQMVAWLCVLRTIEQSLNSAPDSSWPLVVVLDNVDPLPAATQQDLLDELVRVTSDASWGRLRIAIGMRLSTFVQFCGSHRFNSYEHEGPDPIEVLFLRLTIVLLAFDSIEQVSRMSPKMRSATYARLVSLFACITDRYGYFADILAALSGSNIRNCFDLSRVWCLSQATPNGADGPSRDSFRKQLMAELARHVLGNVARGVAREVARCVRSLGQQWTNADLVEDLKVEGIVGEILPVLEHAALATHFMNCPHENDRSPRAIVATAVRSDILALLAADMRYWRSRLDKPSAAAGPPPGYGMLTLCQALKSLVTEAVGRGLAPELVGEVLDTLRRRIAEPTAQRTGEQAELLKWIALALEMTRALDDDAAQWRRRRRYGVAQASSLMPAISHAVASRYDAERLLLSSGQSALNVFSVSGQDICAVGLRVLYFLNQKDDGHVTRRDLQLFLLRHSYSADDIEAALAAMVHIDRRLIFSGVHDHFLGMDSWLKEPSKPVYLGTAGVSYVTKLVLIPSYLQWATWEVAALRALAGSAAAGGAMPLRRVRERLSAARIGLEAVWDDEFKRIEATWKQARPRPEFLRSAELECQSAAADVFFRSLDAFMQVHLINHQSVGRDRAAADDYAQDAQSWLLLGDSILRHHTDLFGAVPPSWKRAVDEANAQARVFHLQ